MCAYAHVYIYKYKKCVCVCVSLELMFCAPFRSPFFHFHIIFFVCVVGVLQWSGTYRRARALYTSLEFVHIGVTSNIPETFHRFLFFLFYLLESQTTTNRSPPILSLFYPLFCLFSFSSLFFCFSSFYPVFSLSKSYCVYSLPHFYIPKCAFGTVLIEYNSGVCKAILPKTHFLAFVLV